MFSTPPPSTSGSTSPSAVDQCSTAAAAIPVDSSNAPLSQHPPLHLDGISYSADGLEVPFDEVVVRDSTQLSPLDALDSLAVSISTLLDPSAPPLHPSSPTSLSAPPDTPASSFKRLIESLSIIQQAFASAEAAGARVFPKDAAKRTCYLPPPPPFHHPPSLNHSYLLSADSAATAIDAALHHSQITHQTLLNDPASLSPTSLADISASATAIEHGLCRSGDQVCFAARYVDINISFFQRVIDATFMFICMFTLYSRL